MAKMALCVKTNTVHPLVYFTHQSKERTVFFSDSVIDDTLSLTELSMQDRTTCETDPSFLQLIPYVMVRRGDEVYSYVRGGSGGESRLHGEMSVGLGGHVDSAPSNVSLKDHLLNEAARELEEEVGLIVDLERLHVVGVLVDATTPVQEVHLGVLCVYDMNKDEVLGTEEEDVVVLGSFKSLEVIGSHFPRLENWSKLALTYLTTN